MDPRAGYTRPAIALHWLIALLVFAGWGLGMYMHDLPASPTKVELVSWHKWIGVTVFLLALARAAWRATHAPPPLPGTTAPWQARAARASHLLFYVLLLAMPLSGWLMSSAKGFQTVWFGVVPIPDLLEKNKALGELLEEVHETLAWTLAALVALHVAAALKHHFVDRDGVLRRMLPVLLATLLLGAGAPRPVDPAQSRITATFRQMNVPVEAEFTAFRGSVEFDPARPAQARARLEVDTASFDLGDDEYNDEARGPEWLDSKAHPRATFVSEKVAAAGADRFNATGTFTLKGRRQPLTVPFTLRRAGGARRYEGQFSVSRKAFGIGDADWDDVLEDAIVVKFRIVTPDA